MKIGLCGSTLKEVEIDRADWPLVQPYKWYLRHGYASTTTHRKGCSRTDKNRNINMPMTFVLLGRTPLGFVVDHIDRNRLNNRRSNLRWVTEIQNRWNTGTRRLAASTYKGVCQDGHRWCARIQGKHLGSFDSEREAALAYDKGARFFFGECAFLNFPEEHYSLPVRYVDFTPKEIKPYSQYVGVSYFGHGGKRVKRWRAVYRKKTLGYYSTEEEAATAYMEAVCIANK